jgi:zinc protease
MVFVLIIWDTKTAKEFFEIATGVRTSATDSAMKEIMYEVNNYRNNGITDEELDFMKKSITQSDALRL